MLSPPQPCRRLICEIPRGLPPSLQRVHLSSKMFVFSAKKSEEAEQRAYERYAEAASTVALVLGFFALIRAAPHVIERLRGPSS